MANEALKTHTLKNGLVLLGEPRPLNQSVSLGFFVKTGARDEVGREAGVSHFLEHMMFKGTEKRSAMDITYELGNLGAQANAYTSEESTVFYATVLPEYFTKMQELLSDMLRPALDPEEFTTEKKVILEEIALYQDRPQFCLFEKSLQAYFDSHPAGNSVLGTTTTIGEVTQPEMKSYFDRRYSPANMALIASGNFDWDTFVAETEKLCGSWKPFETGRKAVKYSRSKPDYKEFKKKGLNQNHLLLITEGATAQEDARYPMTILNLILGDGSGSKLYWDLVETGLAEAAVLDCDEKDGAGCILAYAATDSEKLDEVRDRMMAILSKPLDFTDDELARAKQKLASRIVMSGELPIGRLMSIGNDWLYRGSVSSLKEIVAKVKAVSRADIEAALKQYPMKQWSEYRMMPE